MIKNRLARKSVFDAHWATMEFTAGDITVRPWHEADLPLVAKWMSDPRVLRYFGGRDDASDEARMREVFAEDTPDHRCIFSLAGESIGYIQFCPMDRGEFGFPVHERVWGMDLYIGEPALWNRGIGARLVRAGAEHLLARGFADRVTIDPEAWNLRAVRSYEKAGFVKRMLMPRSELHEGEWRDNWLMEFLPQHGLRVERVTELPLRELQPLRDEATTQGFEFAGRLLDEFASGRNRFDKRGEALFIVRNRDVFAGIGGLNIDPYANDPGVGRVRHVYVMDAQRRQGAGRALLMTILSAAFEAFSELHLRTNTTEGALFYQSLGFSQLNSPSATHIFRFSPKPLP